MQNLNPDTLLSDVTVGQLMAIIIIIAIAIFVGYIIGMLLRTLVMAFLDMEPEQRANIVTHGIIIAAACVFMFVAMKPMIGHIQDGMQKLIQSTESMQERHTEKGGSRP